MRALLFPLALMVALAARAAEPAWTLSVECQMATIPKAAFVSMIDDFGDETKTDAVWENVKKLVSSGQGAIVASLVGQGPEKVEIVAKTVTEMRYATEYEPPQVPEKVPPENAIEALKSWPITGPCPTAFEMREVGAILSTRAEVLGSGALLKVTAAPKHVRFLNWQKFDAGKLASGEHMFIEQPYFHVMSDQAGLLLKNGARSLVGVHDVPDADGIEFFFLRVSAHATASP